VSCKLELEALRHNVPEAPRLDRLLRYETKLERAIDRTLNQLERHQRFRLGQPVPLSVNIYLVIINTRLADGGLARRGTSPMICYHEGI